MKIATWNLQCVRPGSGARSGRIREALVYVDADVLVLTESHPQFNPAPGYQLVGVSTPAPDRVGGGCWVAIWARQGIVADALELHGEPERASAVRITRQVGCPIIVFGTVLPWRGDTRHAEYRGGRAFERGLAAQARDWVAARERDPSAELCVAGDFNQELTANGPVGTRLGRQSLARTLTTHSLRCVTGGESDPLRTRGWRDNIDHVVLSSGLRPVSDIPMIWPEEFPLPTTLPDHYGVCISLEDAP